MVSLVSRVCPWSGYLGGVLLYPVAVKVVMVVDVIRVAGVVEVNRVVEPIGEVRVAEMIRAGGWGG